MYYRKKLRREGGGRCPLRVEGLTLKKYIHLETVMIILTGSDVLAAPRNTQCRDGVRVSAEKSLLSGLDVSYDHLAAHRIKKMLLIRV